MLHILFLEQRNIKNITFFFVSSTDVKYCGAPRDLRVLNVTKFLKTQLVSPYFEWLSPIQINADYKLSLYSVTINWANGTKVQGKTVRHQTNVSKLNETTRY